MEKAIKINNVCHDFGDKRVLNNINLEIGKGEIFGLLGPSGAGKTTLINIIIGQLKNTSGECEVNGILTSQMKGKDYLDLGVMMDNMGLYERLSSYDNLKFFQKLDGKSTDCIDEILDKVGLLSAKKTLFSDLSKGMKNRLAFARAILRSPKILFLDEPTSALDPSTTEEIHKMILEEKKKGTTIFLTTHNMYEAEQLCDHIALLNDGKIIEYGTPQEICNKYNHQKSFKIHLKNGEDVEVPYNKEAASIIEKYIANEEIETIHSSEPNLVTIFMELTGKELEK